MIFWGRYGYYKSSGVTNPRDIVHAAAAEAASQWLNIFSLMAAFLLFEFCFFVPDLAGEKRKCRGKKPKTLARPRPTPLLRPTRHGTSTS
jgi:hypothetical protein